jgi:hypothetical protein
LKQVRCVRRIQDGAAIGRVREQFGGSLLRVDFGATLNGYHCNSRQTAFDRTR